MGFVLTYDYGSSLAAILALWTIFLVDFGYVRWAMPTPIDLEDFVNLDEPQIRPRLCGELYFVSCIGHVRGGE